VDPGRPSAVSPQPATPAAAPAAPTLTLAEKRRLQIMRVQISLTSLGLYTGRVHGELDDDTKDSLKRIQIIKGLPETGLMTTETLNALGVPAVQ
jgi:His-Xaa-Ser repeat protein HxsA